MANVDRSVQSWLSCACIPVVLGSGKAFWVRLCTEAASLAEPSWPWDDEVELVVERRAVLADRLHGDTFADACRRRGCDVLEVHHLLGVAGRG